MPAVPDQYKETEVHPDSWIGRTKAAAAEVGIDLHVSDITWNTGGGQRRRVIDLVEVETGIHYQPGTDEMNRLLITIDALLRIKKRVDTDA